jgi:two-component system, NarL family, response regulator DevR
VGSEFVIVVATGRPSVGAFFTSLGALHSQAVRTTTFDVSTGAVQGASRAILDADVAVVDASLDPAEGLAVCQELRSRRADLRIGILFCCPHAAAPESLRPFLAAGIGSFLDLQLSTEQMLAALRGIARGEDVVRLQLSEDSSTALFNGHSADERLSEDELTLLRLVALGLSDREIGTQMCLSRHTIKHRIERLRRREHARNRIQLAAFAARLEREQGGGSHQHPGGEP